MAYQAKWGPKGFLTTPEKIVPFMDLSTSYSLKSENNTDTSGTEPTNTRGRELQTITFSTKYMSAAGVDPKGQMREWYDLIGAKYPLYIGGKQFGPPLLQLESVDWSNFLYAPDGSIISVEATINLKEYIGPMQPISEKTFASWGDTSVKRSDSSVAADEMLKAAAMNVGPTTEEKQKYKIGGGTST